MVFAQPWLLLGTLAALIPLAVHLFDRRKPRPQPFAAIAFVLRSQRRTASRLRLKRILLYTLRTLILLAIPLALPAPSCDGRARQWPRRAGRRRQCWWWIAAWRCPVPGWAEPLRAGPERGPERPGLARTGGSGHRVALWSGGVVPPAAPGLNRSDARGRWTGCAPPGGPRPGPLPGRRRPRAGGEPHRRQADHPRLGLHRRNPAAGVATTPGARAGRQAHPSRWCSATWPGAGSCSTTTSWPR
jgi:hypothetical protein